jgi:hypothetical protein
MSLYELLSTACPDAPEEGIRTTKTSSRADTIDEAGKLAVLDALGGRTTITKVDRETVDEAQALTWPGLGN